MQSLGYAPGEGILTNFFDETSPPDEYLVTKAEMFINLKKLKN